MSATITIRAADTAPDIVATLSNAVGPQDLTGATVSMRLQLATSTAALDFACTIDSPATAGVVRKVRSAQDAITPGTYNVEYHVVYANAQIQTFPNVPGNTIVVLGQTP